MTEFAQLPDAQDHAARLRTVKYTMGMLYHPQIVNVATPEEQDKLWRVVRIIQATTPITEKDLDAYGRAQSKQIEVVVNTINGVTRLRFRPIDQQAKEPHP